MRCVGKLGMPEVDSFIQYLVNEDEVFPDGLLGYLATEVLDDDDNPVEQFEDEGGEELNLVVATT